MHPNSGTTFAENVALAPLTTLGLGGVARWFHKADSVDSLQAALGWAKERELPLFVLGGGSNLVVADSGFDGLVIQLAWTGVDLNQDGRVVAEAGEHWDSLVGQTVDAGLAGFECLAGIPGLVGATPIQNVGAYGQEVSETIESVQVLNRRTLELSTKTNEECGFGYRDSVFKRNPDAHIVTRVTYQLRPGGAPALRYGELTRFMESEQSSGLQEVHKAVLHLRRRKSMVIDANDPNTRSAGSFFTNPILSAASAQRVVERALASGVVDSESAVPTYPQDDGRVKLAAGWLIERAGINKGLRVGNVGISTAHALALVHHGGGTTSELLDLARRVRDQVEERFSVRLVPEPRILGVSWDA